MIEQKAETEPRKATCKKFRKSVEKELDSTCDEVLNLIDKYLLQNAKDDEERVFYLKMNGDYHRYMAEYKDVDEGNERNEAVQKAQLVYQEAMSIAEAKVKATHPNRLGLALNYSVFFYEILNSPQQACALAKKAFDEAIGDLDNLQNSEDCKDSTLIMQLLRDNLTLWTSEPLQDAGDQDAADQ